MIKSRESVSNKDLFISRSLIKTCWVIFIITSLASIGVYMLHFTSGDISDVLAMMFTQLFGYSLMTFLYTSKNERGLKYHVNVIFIVMITLVCIFFRNPELFAAFYILMAINLSYSDRVLHYISSFFQVVVYLCVSFFVPTLLPVPTNEDSTVSLMVTRITIFFAVALITDILQNYTNQLTKSIHEKEKQILSTALNDSVGALVHALEEKDIHTNGHSKRVSQYAKLIAAEFKDLQLSQELFVTGGLLHDIGKIGISDYILNKQEPLIEQELIEIRKHPVSGAQILQSSFSLQNVLPMVLHHHERYDGKGYPNGLKGEEIPLEARILAVADTYDAITSRRPYREARSPEYALNEILNNNGTQFCPKVVDAFRRVYIKEQLAMQKVGSTCSET